MTRTWTILGLSLLLGFNGTFACYGENAKGITSHPIPQQEQSLQTTESLTVQALADDSQLASQAIAHLRVQGPAGLQALWNEHKPLIERVQLHGQKSLTAAERETWQKLSSALDSTAKQKDAYASGLYWYTDLEQAKQAAKQTGKPILSLRMLGQLTDELSCANSRFFRTTLYPNPAVRQLLAQRFILHWSSERPVPVLTMDMGDGRQIRTTVTGNSIHYLLDADGQPVDALPGLYGPQVFHDQLVQSLTFFHWLADTPQTNRKQQLMTHHQRALAIATNQLQTLAAKAGVDISSKVTDQALATSGLALAPTPPPARRAVPIAAAKSAIERPVLAPTPTVLGDASDEMDEQDWARLASSLSQPPKLDGASIRLLTDKIGESTLFSSQTPLQSQQIQQRIAAFEQLLAEDTVRNEYDLRVKIHRWFAEGGVRDFAQLNQRVYSELFLTPASDPWLGLVAINVYPALENDGILLKK